MTARKRKNSGESENTGAPHKTQKVLLTPKRQDPAPVVQTGQTLWAGNAKNGKRWEIHRGDSLKVLETFTPNRFGCVITSPPYFSQRDYEVQGQIGLEPRIDEYVAAIVSVMTQVRRVMKDDGLLFLNLGDTYYSAKGEPRGVDKKNRARRFGLRAVDASGLGVARKTTIGIPWRVALQMIDAGWTLRSPIIWRRKGALPEPTAKDRPWRTYEMLFMFAKSPKYHFVREPLKNEEDIWTIPARPTNANGHSAAFPDSLVERCLAVGCPENAEVLDPFVGAGTVVRVALASNRPAVGIDLSPRYCESAVELLRKA